MCDDHKVYQVSDDELSNYSEGMIFFFKRVDQTFPSPLSLEFLAAFIVVIPLSKGVFFRLFLELFSLSCSLF